MHPKVSILIPCYNAEQWVGKAIESALEQTYPHTEVIVIDDGSTDNSLEIIQSFGSKIQWATQLNQGGNVTRNHLLERSTGQWLQYLDADDYLLPHKVGEQIEHLKATKDKQANHKIDVLYSPSILEYRNHTSFTQEILPIPEPHDPWILLARWYLPQTNSPLWRKQAIVDVGGWKETQPCCQEHELYLRLLQAGKSFQYCPSAGSIYRQWSETTTCKRNMHLTWKKRLEIEDGIETHLIETGQMTVDRQWAINQARFECARMIWLRDRCWAAQIIHQIHQSQPRFLPRGTSAPKSYQLAYQFIGFEWAEEIADWKRKFLRNSTLEDNSPHTTVPNKYP
ncbi:MAG: glycosyltransferase [Leptolyngbyaceae bacterium]|nr:glycosyltransferase [Leptolyngbyaceae bacterium]